MPEAPIAMHVTATWAMAIDGHIACAHGRTPRLAGARDLSVLTALRRASDALIVGASTVRAIDPPMHAPSERAPAGPLVVVLSRAGDLPSDARALRLQPHGRAPWLVTARPGALANAKLAARASAGTLRHLMCPKAGQAASLHAAPRGRSAIGAVVDADETAGAVAPADSRAEAENDADGRAGAAAPADSRAAPLAICIPTLVAQLAAAGCRRVLVEGGGETLWGFAETGLLDELFVTVAPLLLGGASGPTPLGGRGLAWAERLDMVLQSAEAHGQEVALHYVRRR